MNPIRSILATTDFSMPSRHAADRAARLATETGARLTLLHVVSRGALDSLRQWFAGADSTASQLLADVQRTLAQIAADLAAVHRVEVKTQIATGSAIDEIGRAAAAIDADLIVLGARGAGLLRRMALGSTSERLLRRTDRPVLVVRCTPHGPYQRVMVAVDFSRWSSAALAAAQRVAPQARLALLNAFQVPFEGKLRFAGVDEGTIEHYRGQARAEATRQLNAMARDAGLPAGDWDACIVEGDPWLRIVEQEQSLDCDLVAIGKHGLSAAEELLLGSVTSTVLAEGNRDVLVTPALGAQGG